MSPVQVDYNPYVLDKNIKRILHECSCFIEFIKRVVEKNQMRGLSSILSLFRKSLINSII